MKDIRSIYIFITRFNRTFRVLRDYPLFFQIFSAIRDLALKYYDIHFVYPVHPNPNVSKPAYEILNSLKNVHLIDPLEYELFVYLLKYSYFSLTDKAYVFF